MKAGHRDPHNLVTGRAVSGYLGIWYFLPPRIINQGAGRTASPPAGATPSPSPLSVASRGPFRRATSAALHRERAAAAAGALGVGVGDAEAAAVQVVVEIDHGVVQVHQAALVHDDRHAVELEQLVNLLVD